MKDGSIQILYANGNYAFCKKNSGTWVTTNNKVRDITVKYGLRG